MDNQDVIYNNMMEVKRYREIEFSKHQRKQYLKAKEPYAKRVQYYYEGQFELPISPEYDNNGQLINTPVVPVVPHYILDDLRKIKEIGDAYGDYAIY